MVTSVLDINGDKYTFVDTAGIRKYKNNIEKIGIQKSLESTENSDINLVFLKKVVSNPVAKKVEDLIENIQRSVTGVVVDSEGVPLPGATIIEQGTDNGTTTDFDGNFSIQLENDDAILTISFVGYGDQSIDVSNGDSFNVSLSPEEGSLEEIIITGYGTTRKKDLVSSIAKVSGDALSNQPASSVSNLLQGRAAVP